MFSVIVMHNIMKMVLTFAQVANQPAINALLLQIIASDAIHLKIEN